MSEARAITNLIGNGVASIAVSRWEHELDVDRAQRILAGAAPVENEVVVAPMPAADVVAIHPAA